MMTPAASEATTMIVQGCDRFTAMADEYIFHTKAYFDWFELKLLCVPKLTAMQALVKECHTAFRYLGAGNLGQSER